jgi:hypothetical protein
MRLTIAGPGRSADAHGPLDTNREIPWWFFLIQAAPLPEHMIGVDPEFFLEQHFAMQNGTPGPLTEEVLREYQRCFCTPEAIHASCVNPTDSSAIGAPLLSSRRVSIGWEAQSSRLT